MSVMDGFYDLIDFVGSLGDEIGNILAGEGPADATVAVDDRIRPVVIAGPSGVGKGTLIEKLMKEFPNVFGFSVSHTTRAPRPGEQNGVAYHFTTQEAMLPMIKNNEFLESANVHGNLYGTSKQAVEQVARSGRICILDIDIQGVKSVQTANLDPTPIFIFIKPTSMEELEKRLRGRGTETEEKIQKRLANASGELAFAAEDDGSNFDAVLTNDALEICYDELKSVLEPNLAAVLKFRKKMAAAIRARQTKEAEAAAAAAARASAVTTDTSTASKPAEPAAPAVTPAAAPATALPTAKDPKEEIKALIRQKELEMDAANAAKNRRLSMTLLNEIDSLEKQLAA